MVTNIFEKNYIYESLNYFGYMILVCAITYIISIEGFKLEKKILKNICMYKKKLYLCTRVEQGGSLPDQPIGY